MLHAHFRVHVDTAAQLDDVTYADLVAARQRSVVVGRRRQLLHQRQHVRHRLALTRVAHADDVKTLLDRSPGEHLQLCGRAVRLGHHLWRAKQQPQVVSVTTAGIAQVVYAPVLKPLPCAFDQCQQANRR